MKNKIYSKKKMSIKSLISIIFGLSLMLPSSHASVAAFDFEDFEDLAKEIGAGSSGNNTVIINDIEANADSGGNSAQGGEVVNGQAKTELRSKTIINGQVVEDLSVENSSTGTAEARIKTEIKADPESVEVKSETYDNGIANVSENIKFPPELNPGPVSATSDSDQNLVTENSVPRASGTDSGADTDLEAGNDPHVASTTSDAIIESEISNPAAGNEGVCLGPEEGAQCADSADNEVDDTKMNILVVFWQNLVDSLKKGMDKLFGMFV